MVEKVSILSSAGTVSRARLHRLANALINKGIEVHIWAPGKSSDAPSGAIFHKTINGKSKIHRVIRDLALPFFAPKSICPEGRQGICHLRNTKGSKLLGTLA